MNTYIATCNQKELQIQANSQWKAPLLARIELKAPKSKLGLLSVMLGAKGNKPITHSTASL